MTRLNLQIQCNLYQNTHDFFHRTKTNNSKICSETQKTPIAKAILSKNKVEGITCPDFKPYYKAAVTVWYWHRNRYLDQWDRIETRKRTHIYMGNKYIKKEARLSNGEKVRIFNKWHWGNSAAK